jgi:hypothetical protein
MHTDEYKDLIEDLATNEVDLNLTEKQIERFALRAKELEKETDFDEDALIEELSELVLSRHRDEDDWIYFVEELAKVVLDEILADSDDVSDVEGETDVE